MRLSYSCCAPVCPTLYPPDAESKLEMTDPEFTDHIVAQGKALVRAIEALGTIEPSDLFGAVAGLLQAAYKCRLRAIVEAVPAWVTEEILSASERIGDDRAALWISKN
jgi:hypothetical protein